MSFEFTPKKTIKLKILSTKSDIIKNKFVESEFVESDIVESEFVDINSESERDSECEFYSDCNIEDNNQIEKEENENENEDNDNEETIKPTKIFTIDSPEYKQYKNSILGNPTYITIDFSQYHIKSGKNTKKFCKNIKTYGSNLQIIKEHWKAIANELLTEDNPKMYAEFAIVEYKDYETEDKTSLCELLDGHHRQLALNSIYKLKPNFEIDIKVCLYKSNYPDSPETNILFRKFNIQKPFQVDFKIQDISILIMDKLNAKFNIGKFILIKDIHTGVSRPSIKKSLINDYIQERLNYLKNYHHINANDIHIDSIITNFERENNKLSKQDIKWFNSNDTTISVKMLDKARTHNCFIALLDLKLLVKNCIGEIYN